MMSYRLDELDEPLYSFCAALSVASVTHEDYELLAQVNQSYLAELLASAMKECNGLNKEAAKLCGPVLWRFLLAAVRGAVGCGVTEDTFEPDETPRKGDEREGAEENETASEERSNETQSDNDAVDEGLPSLSEDLGAREIYSSTLQSYSNGNRHGYGHTTLPHNSRNKERDKNFSVPWRCAYCAHANPKCVMGSSPKCDGCLRIYANEEKRPLSFDVDGVHFSTDCDGSLLLRLDGSIKPREPLSPLMHSVWLDVMTRGLCHSMARVELNWSERKLTIHSMTADSSPITLCTQQLFRVERSFDRVEIGDAVRLFFFETHRPLCLFFSDAEQQALFVDLIMLHKRNTTVWAPALCNRLWRRTVISSGATESAQLDGLKEMRLIAVRQPLESTFMQTVVIDLQRQVKEMESGQEDALENALADALVQRLWPPTESEESKDGCINLPDMIAIGLLHLPLKWIQTSDTIERVVGSVMRHEFYLVFNTQAERHPFAGLGNCTKDPHTPHALLLYVRKVHLTKLSNFDCASRSIAQDQAIAAVSFYYHCTHIALVLLSTGVDEASSETEEKCDALRGAWSALDSFGEKERQKHWHRAVTDISQRWDCVIAMGLFGFTRVWTRAGMADELQECIDANEILSGFRQWENHGNNAPCPEETEHEQPRFLYWCRPGLTPVSVHSSMSRAELRCQRPFCRPESLHLPRQPPRRLSCTNWRVELSANGPQLRDGASLVLTAPWIKRPVSFGLRPMEWEGGNASAENPLRVLLNHPSVVHLAPPCTALEWIKAQHVTVTLCGRAAGWTQSNTGVVASATLPMWDLVLPNSPCEAIIPLTRLTTRVGVVRVSVLLETVKEGTRT